MAKAFASNFDFSLEIKEKRQDGKYTILKYGNVFSKEIRNKRPICRNASFALKWTAFRKIIWILWHYNTFDFKNSLLDENSDPDLNFFLTFNEACCFLSWECWSRKFSTIENESFSLLQLNIRSLHNLVNWQYFKYIPL